MAAEPVRAGVYCRMSLARDEDTTKVDDQERICRDLAERLGWEVVDVYPDNNRSAWKKDRHRPEWNRMLEDVNAGKIGAIVVYHGDRLIRQPDDLGALLKLADGKGVRLAAPTGTRDLDNPDDRFILRIEAAMACRESDNTSRRRIAQYERWRREGRVRPGGRGGRAFGFETDGMTQVPAEVAIIREAAGRILVGESTGSVARDLASRSVKSPAGLPMADSTLRKMLARPRYAGLMPDGISPAAWEKVLERPQWEAVAGALAARGAAFTPHATNARRYMLSGIAVCGSCGSLLQVRQSKGRDGRAPAKGYACVRPGCLAVYRAVHLLDAYVTGRVVRRLANPLNEEPELGDEGLVAEMQILQHRRQQAKAYIESLVDHPDQDLGMLHRSVQRFDERLRQLRDQMAGDSRSRMRASHAGLTRDQFAALPLSVRRSVVDACYRVVVLRASGRGPGFRSQDVRMEPYGGGDDERR